MHVQAFTLIGILAFSFMVLAGQANAASCVDLFLIHSERSTVLGPQSTVTGGWLSSNFLVELGPQSRLSGDLLSGGKGILGTKSRVDGNVTLAGRLIRGHGSEVTGAVAETTFVPSCRIPEKEGLQAGRTDITVSKHQPKTLSPGNYGNVKVLPFGKLTLQAGIYTFKSLDVGAKAEIIIASVGLPLEVNVTRYFRFGEFSSVSFPTPIDFRSVRFYTQQCDDVILGRGAKFRGVLTAPNGKVHAQEMAQVQGALYGRLVLLGPKVRVECPASPPIPPIQISQPTEEIPSRLPTVHQVPFNQIVRLKLIPGDLIRLTGFPPPGDSAFDQVNVNFTRVQADTMRLVLLEAGKSYSINGVNVDVAFPYRGDSTQEIIVESGLDTVDVGWGVSIAPRVPSPFAPPIRDLGPAGSTTVLRISEGIFKISNYPSNSFNVITLRIEARDGDTLQGFLNAGENAISLGGMFQSFMFKERGNITLAFHLSFPDHREIAITWHVENRVPAQRSVPRTFTVDSDGIHTVYRFTQDHILGRDLALTFPSDVFTDRQPPTLARLEHNPIGVRLPYGPDTLNGPGYAVNGNLAPGKVVHLALPIPELALLQGIASDSIFIVRFSGGVYTKIMPDSVSGGYIYFTTDSFSWLSAAWRWIGGASGSAVDWVASAGGAVVGGFIQSVDGLADLLKSAYNGLVNLGCSLLSPSTYVKLIGLGGQPTPWSVPQANLSPIFNSPHFDYAPLYAKVYGVGGLRSDLRLCASGNEESERNCWDSARANAELLLADLLLSKASLGITRRFSLIDNSKPQGYTGNWSAYMTLGLPNHSIRDKLTGITYSTDKLFRFSSELLKSAPIILDIFQKCDAAVPLTDEFIQTFGHIKDFAVELARGNLQQSCKEILSVPSDIIDMGQEFLGHDLRVCAEQAAGFANYYNRHNLGAFWLGKPRDAHIIGPSHFFNVFSMLQWADDGYKNTFRAHSNRLRNEIHGYVGFTQDMYRKNNILINAMAGVSFWDWLSRGDMGAYNSTKSWLEAMIGSFGGYAEGTGYLQGEINVGIPYILSAMLRGGAITNADLPPKYLQSGNWLLNSSRTLPGNQVLPGELDDGVVRDPDFFSYGFLTGDGRFTGFQVAHPQPVLGRNVLGYFGLPSTSGYTPILQAVELADGLGTVRLQSGSDILTLSIVGENGNVWTRGFGHDQQDNTSVTLDHSSLGRIIIDPGYNGFTNRDNNDFARFRAHNVPFIPFNGPDGGESFNGKFTLRDLLSAIAAQPNIRNIDWIEPLIFSFIGNFNIGPDAHAGGAPAFAQRIGIGIPLSTAYPARPVASDGIEVRHTSTSGVTNRRAVFYFANHIWIADRVKDMMEMAAQLNWSSSPNVSSDFPRRAAQSPVGGAGSFVNFPQENFAYKIYAEKIIQTSSSPLHSPVFITGFPMDGNPSGFAPYSCPEGVCLRRTTTTVEERVIVPFWSNDGSNGESSVDILRGRQSGQIVLASRDLSSHDWTIRLIGEEAPGVIGWRALGSGTLNPRKTGYYLVTSGALEHTRVILPNGALELLQFSGEGPTP